MTVTHIITGLKEGGAEGALYRLLCQEQQRSDPAISHRVLSLTDEGVVGERIRGLGVPLCCAGMPRGRLTLSGALRAWRFVRAGRRFAAPRRPETRRAAPRRPETRRPETRRPPHLVQTWMYHADLLGALIARLAGCRHIVWGIRHSDLGPASRSLKLIARACAILSRWLPRAAVSNSSVAAATHRRLGYRLPLHVVPNGYDLTALLRDPASGHALRREWGVDERSILFGMVARYHPQKEHERLLAAFARLQDMEKGIEKRQVDGLPDPLLVLVGPGCDESNDALRAAIAAHGLSGRVILAGRRSDIPAVMSALDIHVLASAWGEAFPNVLAEAMACGTPCITTDVGDAAEIVGECGWVVPPSDTAALCTALGEALTEALGEALAPTGTPPVTRAAADPADPADPANPARALAERSQAGRARIAGRYSLAAMSDGFRAVWFAVTRKRVLLLAPSMRGGGAERVLATLASGVDPRRFAVTLALVKAEGPYLAQLPGRIPVIDLGAPRARYAAPALLRTIRRERPDTILSTLGYINLLLALLKPFLPRGTRLIAREANTVSMSVAADAHPRLMAICYRLLYRRFDRVVCQSRYMARDLEGSAGVDPRRISVIYNPLDANAVRAAAARSTPAADEPARSASPGNPSSDTPSPETPTTPANPSHTLRLLAVGRLAPQKGYDLLFEALAGLTRSWHLRILGEGSERARLEALATSLGIEDRLSMPGFADNPHAHMAECHALLLPSRYEGLPNVVIEASCLGLPTIAFDCPGGTGEIVVPGITGELVPCGDTDALCLAIESFDPQRYDPQEIISRTTDRHELSLIIGEYESLL